MKVAISAVSDDLNQQVNPVFGRCSGFLILEVEGKEVKSKSFVPNPAAATPMGAGIAAAQAVVSQAVQVVISGNIGPNALMVLQQSGARFYQAFGLSVQEAITQLADGKLQEMQNPTAPGKPGLGGGRGRGFGRGFGRGAAAGPGFGGGAR